MDKDMNIELEKYIANPEEQEKIKVNNEKLKPEEQEKKEGFGTKLKKVWDKTIFPDMIKERREKKAIERQARKEVMEELKPELKKIIKQQELDKLTGKNKKDMLEKLAKGFEGVGANMDIEKMMGSGSKGKTDVGNMMGIGGNQPGNMFGQQSGIGEQDKINQILGNTPQTKQTNNSKEETPEEKVKRLLR